MSTATVHASCGTELKNYDCPKCKRWVSPYDRKTVEIPVLVWDTDGIGPCSRRFTKLVSPAEAVGKERVVF